MIAGGLLAGVPLMFTALGETISERAGVLNIGLEGMMLLGAYCGFLGAYYGHTVWLGFLAGIGAGMVGSLFMVVLCVWLGLDQIVVGIAITLAGEGHHERAPGRRVRQHLSAARRRRRPSRSRCSTASPSSATASSTSRSIVYLAFGYRRRDRLDLPRDEHRPQPARRGREARGARPAGVSVIATRSWAALATGAFAGLGGAYLAVVGAGIFTPFITQGQGYMAIVIAMLSRGRAPARARLLVRCSAIALSLSDSLQIAGINLSADVVNMLPFASIIVALILFARRSYLPPALALPYVRGAR